MAEQPERVARIGAKGVFELPSAVVDGPERRRVLGAIVGGADGWSKIQLAPSRVANNCSLRGSQRHRGGQPDDRRWLKTMQARGDPEDARQISEARVPFSGTGASVRHNCEQGLSRATCAGEHPLQLRPSDQPAQRIISSDELNPRTRIRPVKAKPATRNRFVTFVLKMTTRGGSTRHTKAGVSCAALLQA